MRREEKRIFSEINKHIGDKNVVRIFDITHQAHKNLEKEGIEIDISFLETLVRNQLFKKGYLFRGEDFAVKRR